MSCLFRPVVKTPNLDRLAVMSVKSHSGNVNLPEASRWMSKEKCIRDSIR